MALLSACRRLLPGLGLALLVLVLVPPASPGARAGEDEAFRSPLRAVLFEDDADLLRVYDGIRRGLEHAQLPRVSQEAPFGAADAKARAAVLARLEAHPPPLLFVLGREAALALEKRLPDVPRVFVDRAWEVNGEAQPPAPQPKAPAAVVRSRIRGSRVAALLRGLALGPGRPRGALTWPATTPALREKARGLAAAAGFELVTEGGGEPPDVLLHLRLREGERPRPFAESVARARRAHVPLLSDDRAHWRHGAAVLVLPDDALLGRVAAEAGRELLAAGRPLLLSRDVEVAEVWLDLEAARAEGLEAPLPFLAGADHLRRGPVDWPAAPPVAAPAPEEGGR